MEFPIYYYDGIIIEIKSIDKNIELIIKLYLSLFICIRIGESEFCCSDSLLDLNKAHRNFIKIAEKLNISLQ